jgi:hypothetical protein
MPPVHDRDVRMCGVLREWRWVFVFLLGKIEVEFFGGLRVSKLRQPTREGS